MSEQNKAVALRFVEALGNGDADGIATTLDKNVQAIAVGTSFLSATRDFETIVTTLGMLKAAFPAGLNFRILTVTAEDERVSVELESHALTVTGVPYNNQYTMLFFIRDGRIYKLKEYFDTKLADAVLLPLVQQAAAGGAA